jgi:hypothetical protein
VQYDPDVIAVIDDPDELKRILRHPGCRAEQQPQAATRLIKIGSTDKFLRYALREMCVRFPVTAVAAVMCLRAAVGAALSRNLALDCHFADALTGGVAAVVVLALRVGAELRESWE